MTKIKILLALFFVLCLIGCQKPKYSSDPLEPLNRVTFKINKVVDKVVLKPTAQTYAAIIPRPVRGLVTNFLQNVHEIPNVANALLQGRWELARQDSARFLINSTWGILGFIDIAGGRGKLPRHRNDFGQTLAIWGCRKSPYLILPLLGPSTIRDTIGLGVDWIVYPPTYLKSVKTRNIIFLINIVNTRTALLKASPLLEEALDEYIFLRDAYLQHRQYLFNYVYEHSEPEAKALSRDLTKGPPE